MSENAKTWVRMAKIGVLAVLATGTALGAACSMKDVRYNAINGTMSFVKGYTSDLWAALFPPADEVINLRGEDE